MKYRISVVVPIYNEESNVEKTVLSLINLLSKDCLDYEIIIVDSNSTDRSREISENLVRKHKKVKYIYQPKRLGFGNGLIEGYKNCKLDYVWYMDADFPYPIEELRKSYPYLDKYDAVIGYKTGKRENWKRKLMSIVYNRLIKFLYHIKYKDVNYSYKIVRNDVLKKMTLISDGWFIDAEILIELKKGNYKVKEIPIPYTIRKTGDSKINNYSKVVLGILKETFGYRRRKSLLGYRI